MPCDCRLLAHARRREPRAGGRIHALVAGVLVGAMAVSAHEGRPQTVNWTHGQWAAYEVQRPQDSKPALDRIELALLRTEDSEGRAWWQLTAFEGGQVRYAVKLLADGFGFLECPPQPATIVRYQFAETGQAPLEYVSKRTGEALLPPFQFVQNLLPHVTSGDLPFFERGTYLGREIVRVGQGAGALDRIPEAKRLLLDPDLTIGASRNFHDVEGRRLYPAGTSPPEGGPEYTYTPFLEADYRELINQVGMNLFTVAPDQRPFVQDEPVFFVCGLEGARIPELLYRSNYWGPVMFMDEPAHLAMARDELQGVTTPRETADKFVAMVAERLHGDGSYGQRGLQRALREAGCDFGPLEFVQDNYPVWETVTASAWYEFKAGLPGFVFEGRYRPQKLADEIKETFGLDFPATPDACLQFNYAWYRGAARHFGGKWGVAVYGQMGLDVVPLAFPRAYDEGASYLWFWTSDHGHHVPYPEQKSITRALRDYEAQHPRPAPPEALSARAQVAIALPYGYHLDDYVLSRDSLWRKPEVMGLDLINAAGVPYRQVLRAALLEVIDCLNQGIEFDLVYWGDGDLTGYREIRLIREDATVERTP